MAGVSRTGCASRALTSLGIRQTPCRSREHRLPCGQGGGDSRAPPWQRGHHCRVGMSAGSRQAPFGGDPLWSLCGSLVIPPNCRGSCSLACHLHSHSRPLSTPWWVLLPGSEASTTSCCTVTVQFLHLASNPFLKPAPTPCLSSVLLLPPPHPLLAEPPGPREHHLPFPVPVPHFLPTVVNIALQGAGLPPGVCYGLSDLGSHIPLVP